MKDFKGYQDKQRATQREKNRFSGPFFKNGFNWKAMSDADKRKVVHGMFLVVGSFFMLKLLFGGRHRPDYQHYGQAPYYDPRYGGSMGGISGREMPPPPHMQQYPYGMPPPPPLHQPQFVN